ncbi:KN motif and ankyrin repeat domain-containing protein 2 isoform X2 [Leopardus geoffroyi]|uniref:KN motif and ankyrin repeat domain-containing protein 2 isoform X2 n=1 Tax=Leopardus geoffroyi TaxID=46844 RepID=UPI001E2660FB|nr:KN motif and ankyrin repeat domain-containing protein 2 isoform X2 [Leopardus geoffroyi]XP_045347935.1 KN motif and ankyrin repeat domain-containing protein 2 isoform X2 [Leopardus geoffroyi]XP_045347936.1 KN motif and ankyrin repeat domain-containing protein 2 isoform X2 [Leopardus geoffroyi]XP_045347937.1 KN motif and ankyrin repeat domain-containing protein 2 isoform X2 [Leopardus geoffroyi]XP_045347938.1 KN motif and ankyrin repeat domain-containing protein 2 isoform X2 [Leopardus geoffr
MAQVLHVPAPFPGTPGPASPPAFPAREPDPPYSVETPYGYRLDLDFLKYVDDIEKGHTLRRVAVQRRPRLSSLPRGPGSWWTSTESLCSNASGDSRHSAYSYCGRGFYPQYGALETRAGFNPRVERTLLDARRRLEDQAAAPTGLGSLTPSAAGSTSSLVGVGLPPPTPRSSGLSTPVPPSAGHLAHVREQMAGALRKLRQLEEQVKLIPVLQVKLSVLQEEKRQLTVQLKSQKFLGHPTGARGRSELCLDLPEPPEDPVTLETRSVGTWVRERDLGVPDGEAALAAKVTVLETQLKKALQELQAAQARHADPQPQARPPPDSPIRVDTVRVVEGPREVEVVASTAAGTPAQRAQSLEPYGTGLRSLAPSGGVESPAAFRSHELVETAFPTSAAPASNVHLVKKISITERSCSDPAGLPQAPAESPSSPPGVAATSLAQPEKKAGGALAREAADSEPARQAASCGSAEAGGAGEPPAGVRSIMKRKEEPADPPAHRRSLQFVGVNGGYESSSEDSSTAENFSDNESTENEAAGPEERVPSVAEAPQLRPSGTAVAKSSQEECQPPREPQHVLVEEGVSGANAEEEIRMELSPDLISACLALEKYLDNPNALSERELKVAYTTVLQEWLRLACRSDAHPELVRRHLVTFRAMSARLLDYVVNIADGNGNTALHYSVSHANFPVVRQLLDSGVCQVDKQNRAGYSPIMLTALATLKTQDDLETVLQLFRLGDVNAKASQAGQTALMLAVSHGRVDVVKALLACEADVNVQDDDGSTALMCACEHGHKEITGLLLAVPSCDISLTDRDGSTALMVALDAGQSEIASMLYSRMNIKCSSRRRSQIHNTQDDVSEPGDANCRKEI